MRCLFLLFALFALTFAGPKVMKWKLSSSSASIGDVAGGTGTWGAGPYNAGMQPVGGAVAGPAVGGVGVGMGGPVVP